MVIIEISRQYTFFIKKYISVESDSNRMIFSIKITVEPCVKLSGLCVKNKKLGWDKYITPYNFAKTYRKDNFNNNCLIKTLSSKT